MNVPHILYSEKKNVYIQTDWVASNRYTSTIQYSNNVYFQYYFSPMWKIIVIGMFYRFGCGLVDVFIYFFKIFLSSYLEYCEKSKS